MKNSIISIILCVALCFALFVPVICADEEEDYEILVEPNFVVTDRYIASEKCDFGGESYNEINRTYNSVYDYVNGGDVIQKYYSGGTLMDASREENQYDGSGKPIGRIRYVGSGSAETAVSEQKYLSVNFLGLYTSVDNYEFDSSTTIPESHCDYKRTRYDQEEDFVFYTYDGKVQYSGHYYAKVDEAENIILEDAKFYSASGELMDENKTQYIYQDGNKTEELFYYNGQLVERYTFKYDDQNRVIEIKLFKYDEELETMVENEYYNTVTYEQTDDNSYDVFYNAVVKDTSEQQLITKFSVVFNEYGECVSEKRFSNKVTHLQLMYEKTYSYVDGPNLLLGDVNLDGSVTSTDALLALQYTVGKVNLWNEFKDVADVDGNGEVNAVDTLLILQYATGKIDHFPCEE